MSAQINAEIENALQCLLETYSLALNYGDEDDKDINKYLDMAVKYCSLTDNQKRHTESLELAKEANNTDEFTEKYQEEMSSRQQKKFDAKKTSAYKNFKEQLKQIQQELDPEYEQLSSRKRTRDETDDMVMESEINIYDPLTKQKMMNPVRNTICKHHYERSSIVEAISINKRLRCPVAGCGNKEFVKQQQLVDDNMFKLRLQKIYEKQAEEESQEY